MLACDTSITASTLKPKRVQCSSDLVVANLDSCAWPGGLAATKEILRSNLSGADWRGARAR